ncbi:methyltransferase domain-containing protein [Actinoplanes sp. NEAU-A12]|uniref:Methyltransferase domain-containing protein n=1 Tax=Actinoplanes sandaracinus TaxID=3045177 RepID=A0ABT6WRP5_9ACTN|nr:methyltransferase domain-containing protein [Actinoplanes sandaracinus]MDI6102412.1 methyltransferase domain-containing protein [Actinoplanes sandaracinus]
MDVFGSVADLYETARPGYPPEVAGAIVDYHGGVPASVAEIGAGTGKGTAVLSTIGAPLTCIEPDPRMATVLRAKYPAAQVRTVPFEQWSPPPGGVGVLACAMAWHWLDPATRNVRARTALAPGGTLAVFGHRYDYADAEQAAAIRAALNALDDTVRERPVDWMYHDVLASGEFTDVRAVRFRRHLPLARDQYLALVRTFGPFLAHPPEMQRQGLDVLGRLVDDFGGTVVMDLRTTLALGRPAR